MGKPIFFGTSMSNFRDITQALLFEDGAVEIAGPDGMLPVLERLLADSGLRQRMGARASACIRASSGATDRVVARIMDLLA